MPSCDSFGNVDGDAERAVGFLLTPTFSILAFVSAVEPLRVANRFSGRALYSWHVITSDGAPAVAANGMCVAAEASIEEVTSFPTVIVCGPHDPNRFESPEITAWLRRLARGGTRLGALDTGAYLLAQARLLDGYRCTVHWENLPGFMEDFPGIDVSSELYEFDRNRFTCGGGTAALDMMLTLIATEQDRRLASMVSELFLHDNIRQAREPQRMNLRARLGIAHSGLLECIALMEKNLEQPLLPAELAARIGVSKRQLERLFRRYLASTPARYYMDLRLQLGRRLLEQTAMPVTEVALACGFASPGHFSYRYRALYGLSPRQTRRSA
jgi:transcriptional regulator GlxA family with amidase domain